MASATDEGALFTVAHTIYQAQGAVPSQTTMAATDERFKNITAALVLNYLAEREDAIAAQARELRNTIRQCDGMISNDLLLRSMRESR